ncbi:FUSC family protein [Escherichia coli]|nr:FUSC family protein [Escherichia coli]
MCLALTVAYYLNLDEPYWAMTSAAVVGFPPLAVSSAKASDASLAALLGPLRALLLAGHTLNEPWFSFEHGGVAWLLYLGLCALHE